MSKLIKKEIGESKKFHGTLRFIDGLCALNCFMTEVPIIKKPVY